MKELLQQLAMYNEWSSRTLFKRLEQLPQEVLQKEMNSSFRGINPTIFHILTAESIWWQRLQLSENVVPPASKLSDQFNVMATDILALAANWIHLVNESTERRLVHVFEYRNSKRIAYKQPLYEVLLHLFNHKTYHHGQIITMLRQQHIDKIPATDFIEFS